jgi:hypothetical protein
MITLYVILSYLVNLGMAIASHKDAPVPTESLFVLLISPITCPIIIGMSIADREE